MIKKAAYYIQFIFKYLVWFLKKPKFPKFEKTLLHIGNGDQHDDRYINIDARPLSNVHIVTNKIHKLNMFKDNNVDLIYVCHIMEHIKIYDLQLVLNEFRRVLKPGGVLRISVPDFDKIINIYNNNNDDLHSVKYVLMGGQDYDFNFHYSVYNENYLKEILLNNGFKYTQNWDPQKAKYYSFNDWASNKYKIKDREYEISLNLEAVK